MGEQKERDTQATQVPDVRPLEYVEEKMRNSNSEPVDRKPYRTYKGDNSIWGVWSESKSTALSKIARAARVNQDDVKIVKVPATITDKGVHLARWMGRVVPGAKRIPGPKRTGVGTTTDRSSAK